MSGRSLSQGADAALTRWVNADHDGLRACIAAQSATACATMARERFTSATGLEPSAVVLLVGCFGSNAVQALDSGRAAAVLCVEHLAPSEHGLRLTVAQGAAWLVHELAHCARYTLPRTRSPLPACTGSAADLRSTLDRLPLVERLVDEGLASALQCEAVEPSDYPATLGFTTEDLARIMAMAPQLLRTLTGEAVSSADSPMLYGPALPNSLAPTRWAYPVGAEIARRARMDSSWPDLLAASAADVLAAAARGSADEWAAMLLELAARTRGSFVPLNPAAGSRP